MKNNKVGWSVVVFLTVLTSAVVFADENVNKAVLSGVKVLEQDGQTIVLDGEKTNAWGYMTFADSGIRDIEIKGTFKIRQAGKAYNPLMIYWPLNYHYQAEEPGYDFGIIVRDQNKGAFYRFQFSTKWDEVSLWKEGEPGADPEAPSIPSGFFAVVKAKAGINISNNYAFSVKVLGNKIELTLNGKQVLAYEDNLLPLEKGGWGLGVFNEARVQVTGLGSGQAGGVIALAAKKRPDFHIANWHGDNVVFDGDEPVARMTQGTAAWVNDVKLKPGYRAQVAWPFIFDRKFRASTWEEMNCTNDTVVGTVLSSGKQNQYLDGKGTMVLRYDSRKGIYYYDLDLTTMLKTDESTPALYDRTAIYYADNVAYNPMPTSEQAVRISYENSATRSSPYRLALVKGSDGTPYRWPVHHFDTVFRKPEYRNKLNWEKWGGIGLAKDSYCIRYPEKIVCPVVEIVSLGDGDYEHYFDNCCATEWDIHLWFQPVRNGEKVTQFKKGESYRERIRILGYPAAEADKLMAESKLLPYYDPTIERPYYVNGVNKFDKGGNVEEMAARLVWEDGGQWDKTTGRNDTFSMRLENNARLQVYIGYNNFSAAAKKAELSAWVKTDATWKGEGIRFGTRFFGKTIKEQWGEYVLPKPGEWQQVTYKIPFPTTDLICVWIETSGKGKLWVDDVEYKKIEE